MKALSLTLIAAVGLIMAPMYSPAQTTSTQTQGGQVNPSLSLGQLPVQPIYQWQKTEPNIVIKNRGNNFLTAGSLWDSKPSTPETEVSTTSGDTTVTQHFEATQPTETTKTLTPHESVESLLIVPLLSCEAWTNYQLPK